LEFALINLLDNAIKFTGSKSVAHIEFGRTVMNGRPAYFIGDNGVGFDPAFARNLLGAFQRLHSLAEFPGTGIGLATVQRIVHRYGGAIRAEAAVDRGATFFFTRTNRRRSRQGVTVSQTRLEFAVMRGCYGNTVTGAAG
jgi:light-regulated signal transduction histidine kinase (bacteriophytochrome)